MHQIGKNRKAVGRKADLLFSCQSLEYGCCECGRYDDTTKELNDGGFKMTKVLKDMIHCIYKSAPNVLRNIVPTGFVQFDKRKTILVRLVLFSLKTKFKLALFKARAPENMCAESFTLTRWIYQKSLVKSQTNCYRLP